MKRYSFKMGDKGFTAMELFIVIMILGVLVGSIILKNPFSVSDYSTIAADQLIADIQYTQMKAMGTGSTKYIAFTTGSREYTIQGEAETKKLPENNTGNIVVTSTNFGGTLYFNSLGEPCLSYSAPNCTVSCNTIAGCTISIGTASTPFKTIKVNAITGKVE